MLESLKINNFVLIPSSSFDLYDGMTVLTGETGSGKSIVLGAISLILGAKAEKEEIRSGEEKAEVEAVFKTDRESVLKYLEEKGIDQNDGKIIIRREIKANGRSSYRVNGAAITISEGQEIGRLLVDLTSQNSSVSLVKKEKQRALLDSSDDIKKLLGEYRKEYSALRSLEKEKSDLIEKIQKVNSERAFIEYSLNELEAAELKEGEDDEISEKLKIASSSEFLVQTLEDAKEGLDSSSRSVNASLSSLLKAKNKDESLSEYYTRLESCSIEISDILMSISEQIASYSFDEYELEALNSRLALLQRIRKKYGGSIESAIKKRDEMKEMIRSSESEEAELDKMEKKIREKLELVTSLSESLHTLRLKRAQTLSKAITKTLESLNMSGSLFKVDVEKTELGEYGADNISFLIAPNRGEKMSTLESAASGGELSRIMLAIKSNFFTSDDVETLIFDEIDTGISGSTAGNVASVMKDLSAKTQIIAITHLAQIARLSDHHILVSKSLEGGRTVSALKYIDGKEKVKEIARLLSGDESEISIKHAESLIS